MGKESVLTVDKTYHGKYKNVKFLVIVFVVVVSIFLLQLNNVFNIHVDEAAFMDGLLLETQGELSFRLCLKLGERKNVHLYNATV